MTHSPSAAQLLADLALHGIHVEAHDDTIRYRPRRAMTPALMERLQTSKGELLAMAIIQEAHDLGNADLANRLPFGFPAGAVVVVMDKDGYTDGNMKGEPYMWTWINGPTWFYVKDYPIPVFGKATPCHVIEQARVLGGNVLAERMAEAWQERLAIASEDGKVSQQAAEEIALKELRAMIDQAKGGGNCVTRIAVWHDDPAQHK